MPADTRRPTPLPETLLRLWRAILAPVGSLKITVVLFVLSGLLVFFGTLAQKGQGVWTVVDNYFYSWWVKVELKYLLEFGKVFLGVHPGHTTSWWVPFPAGKLLGVLMVLNLTAAYLRTFPTDLLALWKQVSKRLKAGGPNRWPLALWEFVLFNLKRFGVYLLHGGVLFLLLGEYITREYAVEQQMVIPEGGSANYAYETRNFELAFIDRTDPVADKVAVLPGKKMKAAVEARDQANKYNLPAPSTRFSHPDLPVDVEVVAYFPNSKVTEIDEELSAILQRVGLKPLPFPSPEQEEAANVSAELSTVWGGFLDARKAAPNDPPLPQFEQALAKFAPERFKSATGQAVLAKLEEEIARLKEKQQATTGLGLTHIAVWEPEVTGVDTTQKIDLPSAYVNLFEKQGGNSLGIYLVSAGLTLDGEPEQPVPGLPVGVELRPTRHYKAYTLHLSDFKFDRYVGTETAKNYSSDVRLEDPALNQDRNVTIRMNEPLRHRGDAIFQSSFTPDEKSTILQVVSNPGWTVPYISCVLVMLGMGVHFVVKLVQFLVRSVKGVKAAPAKPTASAPGTVDLTARTLPPFARYGVPVIAALVAVVVLAAFGTPRGVKKDRLDLQKLATLPVVDGGRVKPLDTVARVHLRQITHAEEASDGKNKRHALQWFMDTATTTPDRQDGPAAWPIFRIENEEVRSLLKLQRREGLRYSLNDLRAEFRPFFEESKKAYEQRRADPKSIGVYQSKLIELADHVRTYQEVLGGQIPLVIPPQGEQGWKRASDVRDELDLEERKTIARAGPRIRARMEAAGMPLDPKQLNEDQQQVARQIMTEELDKEPPVEDKTLAAWDKVLATYAENDPKAFDAAVTEYRKIVAERVPASDFARADLEVFLNQSSLYYWCTGLYVAAGVGSLIGFVLLLLAPKASQTLRRGVFWWLVVTFTAHTFTLLARMYLMDRPLVFVTNLYSSAVFIGWGVVALCLILELVYPIGFGNLVASILGFATTIIAHNLATSGDTLEMMQAVLDTNFWLATHVTTVTLGYAATYVAGVLGLLYVVLYVLPEKTVLRQRVVIGSGIHQLNYDIGKLLGTLIYAVVCFATLLSFVGTVLGGIWADQSWGRFWGWDPKENGAVLIVLWNALILHARWGGLVRERGMAVLSVVGIIVTTWSWFGTNQLGVGLHAYGFNNGLVRLCDWVWGASLFAVLIGVLPWQWVYRGGAPAPPPQAQRVG